MKNIFGERKLVWCFLDHVYKVSEICNDKKLFVRCSLMNFYLFKNELRKEDNKRYQEHRMKALAIGLHQLLKRVIGQEMYKNDHQKRISDAETCRERSDFYCNIGDLTTLYDQSGTGLGSVRSSGISGTATNIFGCKGRETTSENSTVEILLNMHKVQ